MFPNRIFKGWLEALQQEIARWMQELLKDAFNPALFQQFIRALGLDLSQLPGMIGRHPGLDPYQVLGLDRSAGDAEIKARYHDLLRKLHPDTAGMEGTAFLLQVVLAAYRSIAQERGWP